jgi:hypothetical protein
MEYQQDPYDFEDFVFWLVPLSTLEGVRLREVPIITTGKRDRPECDYEIVAYSVLCRFSPSIGPSKEYYRRVFVKDDNGYLSSGVFSGIKLERDFLI